MSNNIEISIILCSNKIKNFKSLISNIESTAENLESIEVLVGCDVGETEFKKFRSSVNSKITIKYHDIYVGDLYDQHIPMSQLLNFCNKDSYYVLALADDMRFKTLGWDKEILKYKNYYKDDIFRLRLGWRKHFNYSDHWQCVSMPENIDVCTKKWRDLVGNIPCFSIDSYNQTVMYYLENFDKFNNSFRATRDIPVNNIKMEKHTGKSIDDRLILKKMITVTNISVSYKIQSIAKKVAARIYCEIIKNEYDIEGPIKHINKSYVIGDIKISYKVPMVKILFFNIFRKLFYLEYGGGGFFKKITEKTLFSFRWLLRVLFNFRTY
jgi:hypothetical protein